MMAVKRTWLCAIFLLLVLLRSNTASARPSPSPPLVPPGFQAGLYASGLQLPTALSFGPDSRLYVSEEDGSILAIGGHRIVRLASVHGVPLGLAWYRRTLYVSYTGAIATLRLRANGLLERPRVVVRGLPTGRHQNDGIVVVGKRIYVGIGSTCDACRESDPRSATVMRFGLQGGGGHVIARGLRNPYGLALQPKTNSLWVTDNGRDDQGMAAPDEVNHIVSGGRYGWPTCWGRGGGNGCAGTIPPVASLPAHAAATGLCFFPGRTFPAVYRGDVFVSEWGATIGPMPNGHRVQRVHFTRTGVIVTDFATGLQHPIAVAVSRDGSLLIADFGDGLIWRVQAIA